MRRLLAGWVIPALLLFSAGTATAGHFDPFENYTETWVDLVDLPEGPTFVLSSFDSSSDDWPLADVPPSVVSNTVFDGDTFVGWEVSVTIPNFIDPLPMKNIEVHFFGSNLDPGALPGVTGITAYDTVGGGQTNEILCPPACNLVSAEGRVVGSDPGFFKYTEHWRIFPNPDWEVIDLFIPVEFDPTGFTIWTQSLDRPKPPDVPEPAALLMLASGLLGLGLAGRRR